MLTIILGYLAKLFFEDLTELFKGDSADSTSLPSSSSDSSSSKHKLGCPVFSMRKGSFLVKITGHFESLSWTPYSSDSSSFDSSF